MRTLCLCMRDILADKEAKEAATVFSSTCDGGHVMFILHDLSR